MDKIKRKNWIILDIGIICFFVYLFLLGGVDESNSHFAAVFFAAIGLFFLTCENMRERLYFSRALSWIAENVFKPKTRFNHIISGCLLIFVGFCIFVSEPITSPKKEFFDEIKRTPEYWIAFILVLLFNLSVGVYTANNTKRKNRAKQEAGQL